MNDKLQEKIREVEDQHFGEIEQSRLADFDKGFLIEAHRFGGALAAVTSIARSLTSKAIEGLMEVEDKKYYSAWLNPATGENFRTFAEYLSSDEVPDLSKSKYYELKELLLSEGSAVFDVFSGKKLLPIKTRKMLAASGVNIELDGDELVIADQRVPVSDKAAVKELVETMHDVLRERDDREAKKDKKIADQAAQIEQGQADFEELQRNLDNLRDGDPFDGALMRTLDALVRLTGEAEKLSKESKAERGGNAMRSLWTQVVNLSQALENTFTYEFGGLGHAPTPGVKKGTQVSDLTKQVLAEDSDFGDLDEE